MDTHVGVAMSGLTADARTLIEHARVETQVAFAVLHHLHPFPMLHAHYWIFHPDAVLPPSHWPAAENI